MTALYLQRDITHSTVYCIQACMMSMEQAMLMGGNEEITVIESTIEVYYKRFKEIHARNKIIKNVAWGIFQKCKKSDYECFFCRECYKEEPSPTFTRKGGVLKKRMETLPQPYATILLNHTPICIQDFWR